MRQPALAADLRILATLLRGMGRGGDHGGRLDRFYAGQAEHYDRFRDRLLHGRQELYDRLAPAPGSSVVDLGGGTGFGIEALGPGLAQLRQLTIVDLCAPLLDIARRRAAAHANVTVVAADAARFRPPAPADAVVFCYALTMIPDWAAAIDNAVAMLRPGGRIGVVDYHLPAAGSGIANGFWRRWFGHDGVMLSAAHLPYLRTRLRPVFVEQRHGAVPYLPGLRAPYYLFVGERQPGRP